MCASEKINGLKDNDLLSIVKLRLAVGFFGEKEQQNWWPSLWLTAYASAFLSPIYGERLDAALYHGLVEAARRVHDERIGVGRVFHLFRLPEGLERRLHEAVVQDNACQDLIDLTESTTAEHSLAELAPDSKEVNPGPMRAGNVSDLRGRKWIGRLAAFYRGAFEASQQTFPYFSER